MPLRPFEERLLADIRPGRSAPRYSLRHIPTNTYVHSEQGGLGVGYFLSPEPFPRPMSTCKQWAKWVETSADWEIVAVEMKPVEVVYPKPKSAKA